MLNKEEFNKMDKMQQLEYINRAVKDNNKSVNELCKIIGIAHSTLSDRFKSIGYKFDKDLKQYILMDNMSHTEPRKKESNIIEPVSKKAVKNVNKGNIKVSEKENRIPTNVSLNGALKKELQIYGILHDKNLSDILNEAGRMYLEKMKK